MIEYYYRTKLPSGIDNMLSPLRVLGSQADPSTIIGFLAQLFSTSPEERQRLLASEPSDYVRSVYLVALYRAGLLADARSFAAKNKLSSLLDRMEINRPAPLTAVRPSSIPADNDLLIGAYMASGDTTFIQRILDNFSDADDGMVSDGLRMGFLQGKWGARFVPKERESVTLGAAQAKYQHETKFDKLLRVLTFSRYQRKSNSDELLRLLTLSCAFWALRSLAEQDDGIQKTLAGFFDRDARLKNLLLVEQAAIGNYLTYLVVILSPAARETTAFGRMSKSALAYENLEPAHEAFAPF